jgi:hypothetical protein
MNGDNMQRADKRKFHYIYRITRDDGKYYIGMHSTDEIEDGYFGSGKLITRSIKKYGKQRHTKEILEHLPNREALKLREKEIVNVEIVDDRRCMNLRLGGAGWSSEEASKVAIAGNKSSKRDKLAAAQKSNATKKLRGSAKGWNTHYGMLGKKHSEKTKQLMSKNKLGEKNNQFGTCWVTNGRPIKIKKDQLEEYLNKGFIRGRKIFRD